MIVGVDIRVLADPRQGGVYEYTANLLKEMVLVDKGVKFKFFYSSLRRPLAVQDWLKLDNIKIYEFRYSNAALFAGAKFFQRPLVDEMIGGADVFFSPHIIPVALSASCPRVVTFHDLSYQRFPEFFSHRRRFWTAFVDPKSQATQAKRLVAVSESTKRDLQSIYQIPESKIKVIYSGMIPSPGGSQERKKIILSVGTLEPRKNIIGLVKAFEIVKEEPDFKDYQLVVVGPKGWLFEDIIESVNSSRYRNQIILKDFVSHQETGTYYQQAAVLVYPSFFEGFGLPPLEAMLQGTPVIGSLNSSLPEVIGDGGLLVNPQSPPALARALREVLSNKEVWAEFSKKATDQAQKFSWSKAAEQTLELLVKTSTEV